MIARVLGAAVLGLMAGAGDAGVAGQPPAAATLEERIRAAEDARAAEGPAMGPILEGLQGSPGERRLAVRALGRLQRESLVPRIAPLLEASGAPIRVDAADALAQAVGSGRAAGAFAILEARAAVERDAEVLGAIARSAGRLPYAAAAEVAAAERLIRRIAQAMESGPVEALADAVHGLDALARRQGKLKGLEPDTRAWLRARVIADLMGAVDVVPGSSRTTSGTQKPKTLPDPILGFVRRLALSALVTLKAVDEALAAAVLGDDDAQLRRLAVLGAAAAGPAAWVEAALARAASDPSFLVRVAALRGRAQSAPDSACAAARAALGDRSPHVVLPAIDLAGQHCGAQPDVIDALVTLRGSSWHTGARALVALAELAPMRAAPRIAQAARSSAWPVRVHAARAAGRARDVETLERLATDPDPNVADAAITALVRLAGRRADHLYLAGIDRDDPQLLRTSAAALAGTPRREEATQAIVTALDRLSAQGRETSRDARMALLDRLEETGVGNESALLSLGRRIADIDPVVAARAADILTRWTGRTVLPQPRPVARAPLPDAAQRAALRASVAVLTMKTGGVVRIRLFPDEAPANVGRFARLVRARYFDGLTFHRVEPGFVIQGGSPHANEYMGDGPYTRDELGRRSHRRGTIGISTRGRDTGDGQIFVNLVDNVRLDHAYTIIGEVIEGMDVIDRVLEADPIAQVRLIPR